jgi:ligand-binding SRPBCC domain-containing protein
LAVRALEKMKSFTLTTSIWLPASLEHVFEFFSRAENLERLTPTFLRFRILTRPPVTLRQGTIIDYRISLHGIPVSWQSEITDWNPPHRFVDEQRRGPYRMWKHVHEFEPDDEGTRVTDRVEYATWGGTIVNTLFVAPDLRRIFAYRHSTLIAHFGGSGAPASPQSSRADHPRRG